MFQESNLATAHNQIALAERYRQFGLDTEYWWIACNEGDDQCHEAARDWSAQLDGRSATINPAQVSRVRVARSY